MNGAGRVNKRAKNHKNKNAKQGTELMKTFIHCKNFASEASFAACCREKNVQV